MKRILISLFLIFISASFSFAQNKTQNVILITLDGVRTEEMFGGLDLDILKSADVKWETSAAYKKYWADTPEVRRERLMPFLWSVLLKTQGSIAGDRAQKSEAKTTNKMLFSYPGYSEILTGQAHDDVIRSNDPGQNPFPTVLNFLQRKLKLNSNQVADFSSWARFDHIATNSPGAFLINAGYKDYPTQNKEAAALSGQQFLTLTPWAEVRHDHYTFKLALAHMKDRHARVMHIGLGETDDWAHMKNYGRVLDALNLTDGFLKELWEFVQSDPAYRDKTTIIITTDHGRGKDAASWFNHWAITPEATYIWMAFISPDAKPRGQWQNAETVYQNQIAATMCKFLGVDYSEQNPDAGKPIEKLFGK